MSLVDVPSGQATNMNLVEPGSAENSYLWHKLNGTHESVGGFGCAMPRTLGCDEAGKISAEDLATIESWINDGADAGCSNGRGDAADPANGGRVGVVDSTVLSLGQTLGAVTDLKIYPFALTVTIPSAAAGPQTLTLSFVDGLSGPGQPVNNTVSFSQGGPIPTTISTTIPTRISTY